ncbi:MAG: biotin transporter BioY [Ignavibacterium sp.]|jgi:biotin transport system substrate-specific component
MSVVKSQSARYLALHSDHAVARIFWISTFALLTAVGAQIEIPVKPVPYTLQTLFVLLAGGLLGARQGFLSMFAYLMLGFLGLPVFASGGFGPATLLGPTGGYLLAFPVAAFVVGTIVEKNEHVLWTTVAMITGLLVIFTAGTIQLAAVTGMSLREAFAGGFLIFSWWDLLKLGAAIAIYRQLRMKAGSV